MTDKKPLALIRDLLSPSIAWDSHAYDSDIDLVIEDNKLVSVVRTVLIDDTKCDSYEAQRKQLNENLGRLRNWLKQRGVKTL